MASMTHHLSELNEYTGAFTAACAFFLFFCVVGVSEVYKTLLRFYEDYRTINRVAEREKWDIESRMH